MTPHHTNLPQYYAVKIEQEHPKFEEFKRKINEMYHTNLGIRLKYYEYRDGRYFNCWKGTPRNTPILTIDEWLEAVEGKPKVGNYYQPLFNHMAEQHGLTLLQTEMDEIIRVVDGMKPHSKPITKTEPSRLEVAAMCLQGLLSDPNAKGSNEAYVNDAFAFADELIKRF